MKVKFLLLAVSIASIGRTQSAPPSEDTLIRKRVFELGEVEFLQKKERINFEEVSQLTLEQHQVLDVTEGLNVLSGIMATKSGARNESMVSVRGFDLRAVPVYMDGIPVYVPYDGYVDLGRFTTYDIGKIVVSKGFSSLLYGPNALGGTINLVSRKPTEKFEFDGAFGMINTNGFNGHLNVGSKIGKFYFQAGYSHLQRAGIILSKDFEGHSLESGKYRENSFRTDKKITAKVDWTPSENQEYVIGYINQQGTKGNPVYIGEDTLNQFFSKPRFWQWPKWNKETIYFISNNTIGERQYLKTRLYFDKFKNILNSFDDSTYTTQDKGYAFQSNYDDYTIGGQIEYGYKLFAKNELKLSAQYKEDIHREHNVGDPVQHYRDATMNFAIEDIWKVNDNMVILPGISYSSRQNLRAENYDSDQDEILSFERVAPSSALNLQVGAFYYFKHQKISTAISRKTRFATIKDRYSYRFGTAIPNPELNPETSLNIDLSYTNTVLEKLSFETSIFYSYLSNAIQNLLLTDVGKFQMQNTGKAQYYGAEVNVNYNIVKSLKIGANYTYLVRENRTDPTIQFTDVPNHKVFAYVQYQPISSLQLIMSTNYYSSRFSTTYGVQTPGFMLMNFSANYQIFKYMSIEAGLKNILDNHYSIVEGYPEEGRNFFVTLRFFNNK